MAYNAKKGSLYGERAGKVGYSDMLKYLENTNALQGIILDNNKKFKQDFLHMWNEFDYKDKEILKKIKVVDGSYLIGNIENAEVGFIQISSIDLRMDDIVGIDDESSYYKYIDNKENSEKFQIMILLKGLHYEKSDTFDSSRKFLYKNLSEKLKETLKWILYKKWDIKLKEKSPKFQCPCCEDEIEMDFDLEESFCSKCNEHIYITDVLSLHILMKYDGKGNEIVSSCMNILEMLMLFTTIREKWQISNKNEISEYLFLKDGPMLFTGQLAKIVARIRDFLEYTKQEKRVVHILGVEKSGHFVEFLEKNKQYLKEKYDKTLYAVLTHKYIRDEIQCIPRRTGFYGERSNWGEKVLVMLDEDTSYVLNIPVGRYIKNNNRPIETDFIGLDRIIATLKTIQSFKYHNALYPIVEVNEMVSISESELGKLLEEFLENIKK